MSQITIKTFKSKLLSPIPQIKIEDEDLMAEEENETFATNKIYQEYITEDVLKRLQNSGSGSGGKKYLKKDMEIIRKAIIPNFDKGASKNELREALIDFIQTKLEEMGEYKNDDEDYNSEAEYRSETSESSVEDLDDL